MRSGVKKRRKVSKRFLLQVSPTGVIHEAHINADGNELIVSEHTPTRIENEILDHCHKLRGLVQNRRSSFQHAATIPIQQHTRWKQEWRAKYAQVMTWQTFLASKLNSRDFEYLRTGHKRSGRGMKL